MVDLRHLVYESGTIRNAHVELLCYAILLKSTAACQDGILAREKEGRNLSAEWTRFVALSDFFAICFRRTFFAAATIGSLKDCCHCFVM
jgi:hypothetical protein